MKKVRSRKAFPVRARNYGGGRIPCKVIKGEHPSKPEKGHLGREGCEGTLRKIEHGKPGNQKNAEADTKRFSSTHLRRKRSLNKSMFMSANSQ